MLLQCLAGLQSVQPGQGVLAGASLWGGVSPTELWEQAVPGAGSARAWLWLCGFPSRAQS